MPEIFILLGYFGEWFFDCLEEVCAVGLCLLGGVVNGCAVSLHSVVE